jgi:hypothetical protein
LGYQKLVGFLLAIPSFVTVEQVEGGDFHARVPSQFSEPSLEDADLRSQSTDQICQSTNENMTSESEREKNGFWNEQEQCEVQNDERDEDLHYEDEQSVDAAGNAEDDAAPAWNEPLAPMVDVVEARTENVETGSSSVEQPFDARRIGMDEMSSFLLDTNSKDLLSVIQRCYQTSQLLKHHEERHTKDQVPCTSR